MEQELLLLTNDLARTRGALSHLEALIEAIVEQHKRHHHPPMALETLADCACQATLALRRAELETLDREARAKEEFVRTYPMRRFAALALRRNGLTRDAAQLALRLAFVAYPRRGIYTRSLAQAQCT